MNRVPDRKTLRREYLKRKGKGYTWMILGSVIFIPAAIVTVVSGWAALLILGALFHTSGGFRTGISCLFVSAICGGLAYAGWRLVLKTLAE